jgi:pimeloyl-ACP methyl ester carboxylesterase
MNKILHALFGSVLLCCCVLLQTDQVEGKEIEISLENGLTVLGTLSMAEDKSLKDDGVVLFLHGTLAHKGMSIVTNEQSLLNARGLNVLSINLSLGLDRRSAMYDCKVPHSHKHSDAETELAAWLAWLKGEGVSSVFMIGHSRGGNQVARYNAQNKSDLVKKVVLIAPQTWSAEKEAIDYEQRYKKALSPILSMMKEKIESGHGDETIKDIDFIYCPKADVTAAAFVDYYKADPKMNTPSLLADISQPVLLIAGANDQVVTDLPKQMASIDLKNVHFRVIEEADHMFIDFAGEDLADQIAEFIQAP